MFRRKHQYITTIISKDNNDDITLKKVYGSKSIENIKKSSIKLSDLKTILIIIISIITFFCGVGAWIFQPSFMSDVLLSVCSGLFTGEVLLGYSGYKDYLRAKYKSIVNNLQDVSNQISHELNWGIFEHVRYDIEEKEISKKMFLAEGADPIAETERVCRFIIKLNGIDDLSWINKKNRYAKELYFELLKNACVIKKYMSTEKDVSVISEKCRSIDDQDLCDYLVKTYLNLSQYNGILEDIIRQIKHQIKHLDKSIL